jgi:hypothetical protein
MRTPFAIAVATPNSPHVMDSLARDVVEDERTRCTRRTMPPLALNR